MKKVVYIFLMLIVGVYFFFGLIVSILRIGEDSIADAVIRMVMLVLVALFEMYLFKRYKKSFNPETIQAKEKQREVAANEKFNKESQVLGSKARQQLLGADLCIKASHMAGLPLAEGAEVFIYRCKDKVVFERNQETIELQINKINDILIKTDIEIQKSYVSSVGGAVGGYVLFGPLGAMVGGRAKEKKSTLTEQYLIFAYESNGSVDYISLDVTNVPNAQLFNTNYYVLTSNERRIKNL